MNSVSPNFSHKKTGDFQHFLSLFSNLENMEQSVGKLRKAYLQFSMSVLLREAGFRGVFMILTKIGAKRVDFQADWQNTS